MKLIEVNKMHDELYKQAMLETAKIANKSLRSMKMGSDTNYSGKNVYEDFSFKDRNDAKIKSEYGCDYYSVNL